MSTIMASAPQYKGEIHMAYTPQSLEDPFAELKAAVISLAVEDYLNLICGFMESTPSVNIEELERFFTGEDFSLYSDLDGNVLMQKIRDHAKKMVVKFNIMKIKKHLYGCYDVNDTSKTIIEGSVYTRKCDAVAHAASLNSLNVLHYQKCRVRDGLV